MVEQGQGGEEYAEECAGLETAVEDVGCED